MIGRGLKQNNFLNLVFNGKNIFVHLYGKDEPRIGRKMGHINITSENISDAFIKAMEIKSKLSN